MKRQTQPRSKVRSGGGRQAIALGPNGVSEDDSPVLREVRRALRKERDLPDKSGRA